MSPSAPIRHRFTVEEYYRMAETGLLDRDDRVELLEGEIIHMAAIGSRHAACVKRLTELLITRLSGRAVVGVQDPIRLSDLSEPQPDLAVLRHRSDFYASAHPEPADVLLVVEVADTTLAWDRSVKAPLYGRSGVAEVWIVDLTAEVVEVLTGPGPRGYAETCQVPRGDLLAVMGTTIGVDEILGT